MLRSTRWASPALLTLASDCSPGNGLDPARVSGRVTQQRGAGHGRRDRLPPRRVDGVVGPTASGSIGPDGTYTILDEESGDRAVLGVHRVGIIGRDPNRLRLDNAITENSSE